MSTCGAGQQRGSLWSNHTLRCIWQCPGGVNRSVFTLWLWGPVVNLGEDALASHAHGEGGTAYGLRLPRR